MFSGRPQIFLSAQHGHDAVRAQPLDPADGHVPQLQARFQPGAAGVAQLTRSRVHARLPRGRVHRRVWGATVGRHSRARAAPPLRQHNVHHGPQRVDSGFRDLHNMNIILYVYVHLYIVFSDQLTTSSYFCSTAACKWTSPCRERTFRARSACGSSGTVGWPAVWTFPAS